MAEARLSDGQVLRAVNDLFLGPRTLSEAFYVRKHIRFWDLARQRSSRAVLSRKIHALQDGAVKVDAAFD